VCYLAEGEHRGKFAHWPPEGGPALIEIPNQYSELPPRENRERTVILKIHGAVDRSGPEAEWDSFVITEEDYVEFLYRMTNDSAVPALFYEHFRDRSFLFLGYSLRDWNLRVVLKSIKKELPAWARQREAGDDEIPPSWAIQRAPSELEQALWLKRGVHIFDVPLDDFVANLRNEMSH